MTAIEIEDLIWSRDHRRISAELSPEDANGKNSAGMPRVEVAGLTGCGETHTIVKILADKANLRAKIGVPIGGAGYSLGNLRV